MGAFLKVFVLPVVAVAAAFLFSESMTGRARLLTSHTIHGAPYFREKHISDLSHVTAIVTGGNTGIGKETARALAAKGAHVVLTSRSVDKGEKAVAEIRSVIADADGGGKIEAMQLDLASLDSVKAFAEKFTSRNLPLNLLINNAGVMKSPGAMFVGQEMSYGFEKTQDGFESHIGVNHIGHHYLTTLLLPTLKAAAPSRVVTLSSASEEGSYPEGIAYDLWRGEKTDRYEDGRAYGQSKRANILFTKKLAALLEGTGVTAYAAHPGVVKSELDRHMMGELSLPAPMAHLFNTAILDTADGALTTLFVATSDAAVNGGFYHPIAVRAEVKHKLGATSAQADELWAKTEEMIGVALKKKE